MVKHDIVDIIQKLKDHATNQPDKVAYMFIKSKEEDNETITYKQLETRVRQIGQMILDAQADNNRVLIMYPPGMEYTTIYLACLYVNYVAIPCYPLSRSSKRERVVNIIEDATPGIIFCKKQVNRDDSWLTENYSIKWLDLEQIEEGYDLASQHIPIDIESIAFLQYTSGSTSTPKGVMVSHKNLVHNLSLIQSGFGLTQESRVLLWLPPFHDMGLIGGILEGLYVGYTVMLMLPVDFIKKPVSWLQYISKYKATVSGGPNFGYDLCIERVTEEQKKELDLSHWVTAFCGAEPIRLQTLKGFYQAFKDCGFDYNNFFPCYGLAEATLFVSGGDNRTEPVSLQFNQNELEKGKVLVADKDEDKSVLLVGSGCSMREQRTVIVNPETCLPCKPHEVGEIWVQGDSVAKGYWKNDDATKETFHAYIKDWDDGPYLRTGDMGFLYNEELFITGRRKDLIIIHGKNYYPNDIEETVEKCHPYFESNGGAAFSIDVANKERLVMVQEIGRSYRKKEINFEEMAQIISEEINKKYDLPVYDFVLVQPREVPKTSSGKVRRQDTKKKYVQGELKIIGSIQANKKEEKNNAKDKQQALSQSSHYMLKTIHTIRDKHTKEIMVQSYLIQKLEEKMPEGLEGDLLHQSLASMGLDSIKTIELMHRIEEELGVSIPLNELLDDITLQGLSVEILHRIMEDKEGSTTHNPTEVVPGIPYPLSRGQKALWFLHKLLPESVAYNVSSAVKLKFPVDKEAMDQAFLAMQQQYPILNVRFVKQEQDIFQVIDERENTVNRVDVTAWSEEDIGCYIGEKVNRPFVLDQDKLIKLYHLIDEKRDHIFLWVMHHSITDFWSLTLLFKSFMEYYTAIIRNQPITYNPYPHYFDFVTYQEDYMESDQGKQHLDSWRSYLDKSPLSINFPLDKPRPHEQTNNGKTLGFHMEQKILDQLTQYSQSQNSTLFTTLLSAFYIILHRYTNDEDLIVGVPIAGRTKAEFSKVVGYCTNTLPVRIQVEGEDRLSTVLQQVQKSLLDVFANQDYPFSAIVEELGIQRDISYTPVYQVLFVYQESSFTENKDFSAFALGMDGYEVTINNLTVESVGYNEEGSQFDFTIMVTTTSKGMELTIRYNTDIFHEETMTQFTKTYIELLNHLPEHHDKVVGEIPLLSDEERQTVIHKWNDTHHSFDENHMLQDMFEEMATQHGEKVALICDNQTMTYKQLNERAEALAQFLMAHGVGQDVKVSIYLDRSFELMVSILGVLKAGGAYIPIDIAFPQDRTSYMLDDAKSSLILTKKDYVNQLPRKDGIHIVVLDEEWNTIAQAKENASKREVTLDNLSYIIYTSGSTGRPKGVMIKHRGLVNLVHAVTGQIDYRPDSCMISLSSVSFDIFVIDALIPLAKGLTVVMTTEAENKDAPAIRQLIQRHQVRMMQTTPSKYKLILNTGEEPKFLRNMTHVIAAGEPFGYGLLDQLSQYENLSIYNGYGPTETTVYSTMCELHKDCKIVIGKPMDNTYVYILNGHLEPQPIGVAGDLYISGHGVSRGYWNQDTLTREKFMADPYREGEIMYQTGDLARWLPDGTIEYMGRLDNQVKLRGYRIEIEEIEKRMLAYEHIDDVVVLMKEDEEGSQYLCAYMVLSQPIDVTKLSRYLQEWLPHYMVPSYFVEVEKMPTTPNGKVDKKQLMTIDDGTYTMEDFTEPENAIEEKLVTLWRHVLRVDKISTSHNFFLIKGDSLKATILINQIRNLFQVRMPLSLIFKYTTIKEQASYIKEQLDHIMDEEGNRLPILKKVKVTGDHTYKASIAQKRVYTMTKLDNTKIAYNMPGLLKIEGKRLDVMTVESIFVSLIQQHPMLRTSFHVIDGEIKQRVHDEVAFHVAYEQVHDSDMTKIASHYIKPFDLEKTPLIRVVLLETTSQQHYIFIDIYHGIADETSLHILIDQFIQKYEGKALEKTDYQYRDYAQWQEESLGSAYMKKKEKYWLDLFKTPPSLQLPTDYAKTTELQYDGNYVEFYGGQVLYHQLQQLAKQENVTMYMLLMTAYTVFLSRLAEQKELVVGTLVGGRTHHELDNLVGMFVNTVPIKHQINEEDNFLTLLERVKKNCLEAFEHQEYPFEKIVTALQETHPTASLIDVLFSYHGQKFPTKETKDLKVSIEELHRPIAKFDLSLEATQHEEDIYFKLEYRTSLFKSETIQRFADLFMNVLEQSVICPRNLIDDMDLVTKKEKEKLLNYAGPIIDKGEDTIIQRFQAQVGKRRDKIAVRDEEGHLTYGQLDEEANKVKDLLVKAGVNKGDVIGFTVDGNRHVVTCLLGILKAQCVCLPIDADYPMDRVKSILADSRCQMVLYDEKVMMPEGIQTWDMNQISKESIEANAVDDSLKEVQLEDRAYLIFTSGSTGKAKGVRLTHKGILNHAYTKIREGKMNENSVVALSLNKCFVASIWQIIAPMIIGAEVVVCDKETRHNPYALFTHSLRHKVTLLEVVPSLLESYVKLLEDGKEPIDLSHLQSIILTGEKVLPSVVNGFYERYDRPLINAYGQSECSDDTLHYHIPYNRNTQVVPIGRPANNTQVYVLNKDLKLLPAGMVGELYISGDGLAQGYVNNEELTQQRFVVNPYEKNTLMFKTGDRVRWNEEGVLEYVGREDRQVKVRGHRIELGDIEAAMLTHPYIHQVVALLTDKKQLVGYYVERAKVDPQQLRRYLLDKLPSYMVPDQLIALEEIPCNPNGKIDYSALQHKKEGEQPKEEHLPSNKIEEKLVNIMEGILNRQDISTRDSFFEMGGDSLIAYQVIHQIEQEFHMTIPYKTFFKLTTIKQLGDYIIDAMLYQKDHEHKEQHCNGKQKEVALVVDKERVHEPFVLTPIQEAYWFGRRQAYELGDVSAHGYLEFDMKNLDVARLEQAFNTLVQRHEMLRAIIYDNGMQSILEHVPPYKIKVHDLSNLQQDQIIAKQEDIRGAMSHEVLPSDQWPLFKVEVSKGKDDNDRMHLSIDMLIVDAYSLNLLLQELNQYYREPSFTLPAIDMSYRDYVIYEQQVEGTHEEAKKYWDETIQHLSPAPELPLIMDASKLPKTMFKRRTATIHSKHWSMLKEKAAGFGLTPTVVLLSVFGQVLARWSQQKAFTLNMTMFKRPMIHKDIHNVVGDFTTLLLISMDAIGCTSFKDFATTLQDQMMERMDYHVNGVEIMRQYANNHHQLGKATMPVVFTSIMNTNPGSNEHHDNLFEDSLSYAISQTPQVYLDNQVTERQQALVINWDAVDDLFKEGLLDDMFNCYKDLIINLAKSYEPWNKLTHQLIPVSQNQLDIIDTREKVETEYEPSLLLDGFHRHVVNNPSLVAIWDQGKTLTYEETDLLASKIKSWLLTHQPKRTDLVAVILEKGWEQIIAVIGILKSGLTYVPIDPHLPKERIQRIIEDGEIDVVITCSAHEEQLKGMDMTYFYLDNQEDVLTIPDREEDVVCSSEDLAYIIYTSGSTGQPKGVMIDHQGAMNTIMDMNKRFHVTCDDKVLQMSSLNFDLSVYDIFGMLSGGGSIIIPDKDRLQDPAHWLTLLEDNRVTLWNTVPAYMEMLVEYLNGNGKTLPDSLRLILLSGDKIAMDLPKRIYALSSSKTEIISLGGATEASIWSILYPIKPDYDATTPIPYGKSMDNQICYVMDHQLQIQPIGVKGEIVIGGIGVAKGYFKDEERTKERFVTNPITGEYLYKTGDVGMYDDDGNILILGRMDNMVKLRGHRIELGEIETVLNQNEQIKTSAVIITGEKDQEKQLVAYYVKHDKEAIGTTEAGTEIGITEAGTEIGTIETGTIGITAGKDITETKTQIQQEGLITNPLKRLKFKMDHHNVNPSDEGERISMAVDERQDLHYIQRRSYREFSSEPIPFNTFRQFIGCLLPTQIEGYPLPKYHYASAGSLYPVQIYIYVKKDSIENIEEGIYYVNILSQELVKVSKDEETITKEDYAAANQEIFHKGAFVIFLIGKMNAIRPMYSNWSQNFCYIEAGIISHMLEQEAIDYQLGLCQIGGFEFHNIRDKFDLTKDQIYLHSLVGGQVKEESRTVEGLLLDNQSTVALLNQLGEVASSSEVWMDDGFYEEPSPKQKKVDLALQLKKHVKKYLPEYMIPSVFIQVDELPLTANGKVDYKNLAGRQIYEKAQPVEKTLPTSQMEKEIYQLWVEELQGEHFGVDDNFFDVGGTSVKMIRLYNKLCDRYGVNFPVVKMFEYTTVSLLSQWIQSMLESTPKENRSDNHQEKGTRRKQRMERYKDQVDRRRRKNNG